MKVKELKELIKDLPDDALICLYDAFYLREVCAGEFWPWYNCFSLSANDEPKFTEWSNFVKHMQEKESAHDEKIDIELDDGETKFSMVRLGRRRS